VTPGVDEVFLTGASGFVGGHVLRALLQHDFLVRALVRPQSRPLPPLVGCTPVVGDLLRAGELARHMEGCRYLVHVAAVYSFGPDRRDAIWETNVRGCASILEAARIAGLERAVVTSSSSTVGPARDGRPATEEDRPQENGTAGALCAPLGMRPAGAGTPVSASSYHHSKLEEERVALAAQLPAVLVLPTAPVGPGDARPTPTGKMVLDFVRGRLFATLEGGLNIVPVEDVAGAHVLALQRGRPGERYLIGGENLSLARLWEVLAGICNRPAPTRKLPYSLALAIGWADELRCRLRPGDQPVAPLEGVRMGRLEMFVRDEKARRELGYASTSIKAALERAVRWYRDHGYLQ
jgi:dihydroflavonol-4-reductase